MHSPADEYRRVGDLMQSEASRVAEWVHAHETDDVPYEVYMAALEVSRCVEEWTDLRRADVRKEQ